MIINRTSNWLVLKNLSVRGEYDQNNWVWRQYHRPIFYLHFNVMLFSTTNSCLSRIYKLLKNCPGFTLACIKTKAISQLCLFNVNNMFIICFVEIFKNNNREHIILCTLRKNKWIKNTVAQCTYSYTELIKQWII